MEGYRLIQTNHHQYFKLWTIMQWTRHLQPTAVPCLNPVGKDHAQSKRNDKICLFPQVATAQRDLFGSWHR